MGRAITMENRQDELDRRLKLVEDALEELSHELVNTTKIHHVDLTDKSNNHKRTLKKTPKKTVSA